MLMICVFSTTPNWKWQSEAIKNGAAKYNETTAKFEWIKREDK